MNEQKTKAKSWRVSRTLNSLVSFQASLFVLVVGLFIAPIICACKWADNGGGMNAISKEYLKDLFEIFKTNV